MTKKFIVITSIFPPTEPVKQFAALKDWQLVVVGDKKTPLDWHLDNVVYLGPNDQEKLGFSTLKHLPWNHYCRKMIGYLYAIKEGAEQIADSDDDNQPLEGWPALPDPGANSKVISGTKFINAYKYFTDEFVWPRGFPLNHVLKEGRPVERFDSAKVGIWQFLANGDPDVDAIYRLTINKPITFKEAPAIILDKNTACPFNSQNTIFSKEVFPLLFLPAFVTFRFTDILRGLVAQPILWKNNFQLGFGKATVFQDRNPHDYLQDFNSEIPVYLHSERVIDVAEQTLVAKDEGSISENLKSVYRALEKEKIVNNQELTLLNYWLNDVGKLS